MMRQSQQASRPGKTTELAPALGVAIAIAGALVGVWLWSTSVANGEFGRGPSTAVLVSLGANVPSLVDAGEWHRILTATMLHSGFGHVAQNALWILLLGTAYARLTRPRNLMLIALLSGVLGQAASYVVRAGSSVGASGAVYGLAGALVVVVWMRRGRLAPDVRWRVLLCAAVFVAVLLIAPLLMANADHAAHLGGFTSGALLAWALSYRRPIPR